MYPSFLFLSSLLFHIVLRLPMPFHSTQADLPFSTAIFPSPSTPTLTSPSPLLFQPPPLLLNSLKFFSHMFRSLGQNPEQTIYTHSTSAIDTQQLSIVIGAVTDTITRTNLKDVSSFSSSKDRYPGAQADDGVVLFPGWLHVTPLPSNYLSAF